MLGGQVLGDYPSDLSEDGSQNIGRGRLIPTSPWEAVWNAVAGWFGVSDSDMTYVLPNLGNFNSSSCCGNIISEEDLFKWTTDDDDGGDDGGDDDDDMTASPVTSPASDDATAATPSPTFKPTASPTVPPGSPSRKPVPAPTPAPIPAPTAAPSPAPTAGQTPLPSTAAPTPLPSIGCEADEFVYRFMLYDTGGDGWGGATYTIHNSSDLRTTEEGSLVASGTLSDGAKESHWICLVDGCYELVVGGGSADSELGFEFIDEDGDHFQVGNDDTCCRVRIASLHH